VTDSDCPIGCPDCRMLLLCIAALLAGIVSACPRLPPVAGCTPGAQRCERDTPEVCSATQRWHRAGDLPCSAVGGVCAVHDGIARCARDGGVP
jgi:hypothetical protein